MEITLRENKTKQKIKLFLGQYNIIRKTNSPEVYLSGEGLEKEILLGSDLSVSRKSPLQIIVAEDSLTISSPDLAEYVHVNFTPRKIDSAGRYEFQAGVRTCFELEIK